MGQLGDGQPLKPDSSRPGECHQKNSITAEDHIFNPRHGRDLKRHARLKRADMARMHPQCLTRLQITHHELSRKFEPRHSLSAKLLQQKTIAAEDARPERLLESKRKLHLRRSAQKPMPMNHVFVRW